MDDFDFYADVPSDEEESDEAGHSYGAPGRDSIIFAIDCCEQMFQAPDDDSEDCETPFSKICEGVKDMLRNKIICSERDLQGVLLFGTKQKKNQEDFDHINVVQELDTPSAARIEELQRLQESSKEELETMYGSNSEHQVGEVLWCCSSMFSRCTVTLSLKTLVIFTWNDDPHANDRNAHRIARTKAKDLLDLDIDVQVLSFNKDFEYDKFYKDVMSDPENEPPFAHNPIDGIKDLYELLLRKCTKQRPIGKIPFQLSPGIEMSVGVYTAARRQNKGANINIDKKTNQQVFVKTNFVENATGQILMPADIKQLQKWGDRDIVFDTDEVKDMRRFGASGMTLLGFKPREKAIKSWKHVKPAQFIYPNENSVKGSCTLFSALLKKCVEKDVVPICKLTPRINSAPRCVALLPQQEEFDEESGEQKVSPGFHVIYLPFSDDIRNVEVDDHPLPTDEEVEAAENVIQKLKFSYSTSNIDNPSLQTHYQNLEAMALDKDEPVEVPDYTSPNVERIRKKAGTLINIFKELVYPKDYSPGAKSKPKPKAEKRKAVGSGDANSSKKPSVAEIDMREYAQTGQLAKLTVPVLKDFCKNSGISVTGKKIDFIDAIEKHFS